MVIQGVQGLLHGGDYNPEQWMDQKQTLWKQDMELAKRAGINTLTIGVFSWSMLEPEDGEYRFEWLDEVMDMLAENGLKAILATPSGARPPWLAQKYPDVLRMTGDRQRRVYGGRHNSCVSSPDFRRKVTQINTLLAERYQSHPALGMWHVSNEYNNDCHCPLCQAAFRQWLAARYGTLEKLNRAWWNAFWSHWYTSFEQIESPTGPSTLGEWESPGLALAWKRFTSDHVIDFYRMESEPLRRITPEIPITTNLMHTFEQINYFALGRELDYASWDNYPDWKGDARDRAASDLAAFRHDLMRGVGKQKPFLMMESSPSVVNWMAHNTLRKPGTLMYQSLQAIAHGSDSVQYFQFRAGRGGSEQFHGAVVDHSGRSDTRVFREVAAVGETLARLAPVAGSTAPNQIALVYDWENRWALEDAWFLHRWHQHYEETVLAHHTALSAAGYGVNMVDQLASLSAYRVVCAPMSYLLRDGLACRLNDFVSGGGILVLTYASGYVDADGLALCGEDPARLDSITGVRPEEIDAFDENRPNHFLWMGKRYDVTEVAELVRVQGAETLATYAEQFYAGLPALTRFSCGKGVCYYIAGRTRTDFLVDFYQTVLRETGCQPLAESLTEGLTLTARENPDGAYLFLQNSVHASGQAKLNRPMLDMVTGELVDGICTVAPLSVRVLASKSSANG